MRTSVKIYAILALVICVGVVGTLKGWFGGGKSKPQETVIEPTEPVIEVRTDPEKYAPLRPRTGTGTTPTRPPVSTPTTTTTTTTPVPTETQNFQSIDDIIGATSLDDTQKVQQLLVLFPKLKPEDQEEAIQHMSNLTSDEAYAPLAKMFKDPKQSEDVLDALMTDVLNRGDALKLPLLLEAAKQPNHAMASDARDVLEIYLEKDYGNDWTAWDQAIKEWLKENSE